ncbi:carbohydrate kinase family protein [Corticibacter populi]|uniref:Carbohydrate kinase family protein n=1 Tax=Corticibacter populi TaxID=1550736 RepID=A0A3M6QM07_9BURK|nr:carbohydrate kinase family protein [Corticibacter populi]RMX04118.1 carbohydrate kinase family protein [Corticibacter populi]RZS33129.1 adenosine kinase [Corticibacter populi]
MAVLVCGSLAFDTIMNFDGSFAQQILPAQLHILNVSFLVKELRRDFGGCAGNIAYGMRLLNNQPLPMAALGRDGASYLERLARLGIDRRYVLQLEDSYTAQAMIMTDLDNNQITAFHPGAMAQAHRLRIEDLPPEVGLAIVAPDGREAMLEHARQLSALGIPWVFDPGQGLPMFSGAELRQFIEGASWVTVNDYEAQLLCERTGWSFKDISSRLRALVVTLGALGCDIWEQGEKERVAAIEVERPLDPTGCGDAWRAALLHGLERGWPLARCAALGNHVAARKLATHGPQNYDLEGLDLTAFVP